MPQLSLHIRSLTILQPLSLFYFNCMKQLSAASAAEISKTFYSLIGRKGLLFVDSLFVMSGLEGDAIRRGHMLGGGM